MRQCQGQVGRRTPEGTSDPLGSRRERSGWSANRHLPPLAESSTGNTGGPDREEKKRAEREGKASGNPARPCAGVRVASGLGVRESLIQGEGPQASRSHRTSAASRTRQLSPVDSGEGGGRETAEAPGSREPYALKVARPVLTGGRWNRAWSDRALGLPTQEWAADFFRFS